MDSRLTKLALYSNYNGLTPCARVRKPGNRNRPDGLVQSPAAHSLQKGVAGSTSSRSSEIAAPQLVQVP